MSSSKRIIALAVVVSGIVAIGLLPHINQAADATYTRRYEDTGAQQPTDLRPVFTMPNPDTATDTTRKTKRAVTSQQKAEPSPGATMKVEPPSYSKKLYKKERIRSTDKVSKISPQMFSRAAQFVQEPIVVDSLPEAEAEIVLAADSVAADTLVVEARKE